jgi:aspartate/methionine/tyrosine aminotransferase
MRGRRSLRTAFAALAEKYITGGHRVSPDAITVGAGCGALIQTLSFLLLDAGDAVLLPTPTYAALYNDFTIFADAAVVDVPLRMAGAVPVPPTPEDFDAAAARAEADGRRVRMLFLINPDNPTGVVLPAATIRAAIAWARGKDDVHVVVDEIYALSVFSDATPFVSAVEICAADGGLGDRIHVLWGFSKDFCASGLRTGLLYSESAALLAALDNAGYFMTVSHDTQDALASLLSDDTWLRDFFSKNHGNLGDAYEMVRSSLSRARLPFAPATSGMFVLLSLAEFLAENSFAAEQKLSLALFEDARLVFTPGEAMHAPSPGFYRVCFAYGSFASLGEALRRLEVFVAKRRSMRVRARVALGEDMYA